MIQILGVLAIGAYGGYKLYKFIEEETKKENIEENKDFVLKKRKIIVNELAKRDLVLVAKEIQKEVARLHEIYLTTSKLTAAGEMKNLDIRIDGIPLEEKLKEQEKKLMEISLKIKNLN